MHRCSSQNSTKYSQAKLEKGAGLIYGCLNHGTRLTTPPRNLHASFRMIKPQQTTNHARNPRQNALYPFTCSSPELLKYKHTYLNNLRTELLTTIFRKMTSSSPARPPSPTSSFYAMSDDDEGEYNTITHVNSGRGVKLLYSKSKVRFSSHPQSSTAGSSIDSMSRSTSTPPHLRRTTSLATSPFYNRSLLPILVPPLPQPQPQKPRPGPQLPYC